jgi:hypothetical protein
LEGGSRDAIEEEEQVAERIGIGGMKATGREENSLALRVAARPVT